MAQNVTVAGASFSDVPSVSLPKTGGGTASFTDVSDTTATAADVAAGSYFYTAAGVRTAGTASGGGNDLIITASWDSANSKWVLDKTFAEISAAHYAGKTIAVWGDDYGTADGMYIEDSPNDFFAYWVMQQNGDDLDYWSYTANARGTTLGFHDTFIYPNFTSPTRTYTPTASQQTETITFDPSSYNGIQQVGVTVNGDANLVAGNIKSGTTIFGVQGTYSGGGNDFIITISYNSTTQMWEPDCTVYEWQDAYAGGKDIVLDGDGCSIAGWFYDDDYSFIYAVYTDSSALNAIDLHQYMYTTQGIDDGGTETYILPTFDSPTRTYTPTTSQQTETITFDPTYNGIQQVGITVNAMPSGTAGTPTATKGSVSNHSVSVTPSVTNTTGYITGGTKTGTAVSVSASELVSGTLSITSSGTKDVTNYASASVASGGATASATKGAVSNHSVTVTPSVTRTAGYVTAGTASGTAVTVSASELVSGSETKTANGTYDVTNLAELVVNVSGGGGSSKNVQVAQSTSRATSSTYTNVISLTCSTAGTYTIYWDCFRSSTSGTSGSQLYIGGTASGNANTTFTNHVQTNKRTGVTLAANQTVAVYARSRGSNYYAYVSTLVIEQTA